MISFLIGLELMSNLLNSILLNCKRDEVFLCKSSFSML